MSHLYRVISGRGTTGIAFLCVQMLFTAVTVWGNDHNFAAPVEVDISITSQLTEPEKAMLEEFRRDNTELREFYRNIRIDATCTEVGLARLSNAENPEGKSLSQYTYRALGEKMRLDIHRLSPLTAEPTGTSGVVLVRPEGFVAAEKRVSDEAYSVKNWGADRLIGLGMIRDVRFPDAVHATNYSFTEALMLTRLPNAATHVIKDIKEIEEAGRQCVNVVIECSFKRGSSRWDITFLRDGKWAVKRFRFEDRGEKPDDNSIMMAEFEYDGEPGEMPLLKSGRYWMDAPQPEGKKWQETFQIDRIKPGGATLDDFSLDSIGLQIGEQRVNWTRRLVALGVGLLLVAVFLIMRRGRK